MNEYEKRQINLMHKIIASYRSGRLPLSQLIPDLEALLNCLDSFPEHLRSDFLSIWGTLEEIYAYGLEYNNGHLKDNDEKEIDKTLLNLKLLIDSFYQDPVSE